jgi:crossover junction endodeoxyribonuclease RusA
MFDNWAVVLELFVAGLAAPQGSKNYMGRAKNGKGIMKESSEGVKPWRADVRTACAEAWGEGRPPLDCPVRLTLGFTRKRPLSAPKRRTPAATTAPDLSKLVRSTEDAITSAGVWVDDARVIELITFKRVAELGQVPGCYIRIEVPT